MTTRTSVLCFLLAALAACRSVPSRSGSGRAAPSRPATVAAVIAAEDAWLAALHNADFRALERLLAPEFVLAAAGSKSTVTMSRSEWFVGAHEEEQKGLRTVEGRLLRVVAAGDDYAVVEVEQRWLGRLYFVSDIWVRRDGQWQVAYRHSSPSGEPNTK